jgi:hypothetical protein
VSGLCIVGIPVEGRESLVLLADELNLESSIAEHRYFDGADFVDLAVPLILSSGMWLTLSTWIRSRAATQQATRISVGGIETTAVKPADVERLIRLLEDAVTVDD